MYRLRFSGDSVSSCCSIRSMFSVVTPRIWVSPRSNSALPCTRGQVTDLGAQGADVGQPAAVHPDLVPQHPLADQVLGDGAEGVADLRGAAGELLGQLLVDGGLDLVGAVVPLLLAGQGQRIGQAGGLGGCRSTASKTSSWYGGKTGKSATGLAALVASSDCASQSTRRNGLAASRPSATTSSVGAVAPPAIELDRCSRWLRPRPS